ncbi:MAG: hypothetical protein JRI39_00510 [Deltaproteobacteria bacterium]|nr:hypothetical protein [Deltaproteobacteria bacterium]
MITLDLETPGVLPADTEEALAYLHGLVISQNQVLMELIEGLFKESHAEPDKPREGMFRFADGSDWNPGSGRGLYQYVSGSWVKL